MTPAEREALFIDGERELRDWLGYTFQLHLTPAQAMALLGTIQLALRHPANVGPTARAMRDLALMIENWLQDCGPAVKKLCELGWNPDEDVP
jgi:hypothetical protein